jgi:hypothetical protein
MPTLLELQATMREELLTARPQRVSRLSAVISDRELPAESRLQIHRNHVMSSLSEALSGIYAAVRAVVGDAFFGSLTPHFIEAHPPVEPMLFRFGACFPDFLAGFGPVQSLPYLPDLARLEWAMHDSFHAADCVLLSPDELGAVPEFALADLRLSLHSTARLVASRWPVDRIWLAARPDGDVDAGDIDLASEGARVFVLRQDGDVRFWPVSAGEWELLSAIAAGHELSRSAAIVALTEPNFDLGAALATHLERGSFASIGSLGELAEGEPGN